MVFRRYIYSFLFFTVTFYCQAQTRETAFDLNIDSVNQLIIKLDTASIKDSAWAYHYFELNKIAFNRQKTSDIRAAFLYMQNVRKHWERISSYPLLSAMVNENVGYAFFYLDMPDSSEFYLQQALEIYESEQIDSSKITNYANTLGWVCFRLGYLQENSIYNQYKAEFYYKKAIDYISQSTNKLRNENLAWWYLRLGTVCSNRDDEEMALHYFDESKRLVAEHQIDTLGLMSSIEVSEANVYLEIGRYADAVMIFTSMINQAQHGNPEYRFIELYYNNLGLALNELGLHQEALEAFKSSLTSLGSPSCYYSTYNNIGFTFWQMDMSDSAFYYFDKGIELAHECYNSGHEQIVNAYLFPIRAYVAKAHYAKSIELSTKCLEEYLMSVVGDKSLEGLCYKNLYGSEAIYEVLFEHSVAEMNESNDLEGLNKALGYFLLLDSLAEFQRTYLQTDMSKIRIGNKTKDLYGQTLKCVDHILSAGGVVSMDVPYRIMERSRARLLQESIVSNSTVSSSPLIQEEISLCNRELELLNELHDQIRMGVDGEQEIQRINGQLFKIRTVLKEIKDSIKLQYPDYFKLKYSAEAGSITDLIQMAKKHEMCILDYFVNYQGVYALIIKPNGLVSFHRLGDSETLRLQIQKVHGLLSEGLRVKDKRGQFEEFCQLSHQLYTELLPVEQFGTMPSKLMVITDEILGALPFELLLTKNVTNEKVDYRSLPYLVKECEVQYSYSANVILEKSKQPRKQQQGKALAFAFSDRESVKVNGKIYTPLPGAKKEIEGLREVFPEARIFLEGDHCSESTFKKEVAGYDILHLALHGIADTVSVFNSALIFPEIDSAGEDGMLYNHEIYSMVNLPYLVVLSACESGIGRLESSEGMLSVGRAFLNGGSDNVILSTWQVNDAVSAKLFRDFYTYYAQNESTSKALRLAKLKFIESADEYSAFPGYWGAYVHVASGINNKTAWYLYVIGIGIIVSVLIVLYYFYYNKKAAL